MTSPEVVVGRVTVEVEASAKGFAQSLRKAILQEFKSAGIGKQLTEQLSKVKVRVPVQPFFDPKSLPAQIPVPRNRRPKVPTSPDFDPKDMPDEIPVPKNKQPKVPTQLDPLIKEFQAQMRRETAKLAKQIAVNIPAIPDTAGLRSRLAAELEQIQSRLKVEVPTEPEDKRKYEQELRRLVDAVARDVEVKIPVKVPPADAVREVRTAAKVAEAAAPPVQLEVEVNHRAAIAAARRAAQQIGSVLAGGITTSVRGSLQFVTSAIGATVKASSAALSAVGTAIGAAIKASGVALVAGIAASAVAGLASAAAAAIPVLISLGAALVDAAGVLVALPGAIAIAGAAIGTLKIGLSGLDASFKALAKGDAKAFEESLKNLAPNARTFAREVQRLQKHFKALRLKVQNELFRDTAAVLGQLARRVLPTLSIGMQQLARRINNEVIKAIRGLNTAANASVIERIFDNAKVSVQNLAVAFRPLGQALFDVLAVSSDFATSLTDEAGGALAELGKQLSDMAKSGELKQIFDDGVAAAKQFFALGKDILGILSGLGRAIGGVDSKGGVFGFFDRLNEIVNRDDVQAAIGSIFDSLADVGIALTPVLVTLANALVPVADGIGQIAIAFAPGLQQVAAALGAALTAMVPAIVALTPALSALSTALVPLGETLAGLITGFAPGLTVLIDGLTSALAGLAPIAPQVGAALGQVAAAAAPLLPLLGGALANALLALAPAITALQPAATALIGAISPLATIISGLITGAAPGLTTFITGLSTALAGLAPIAPVVGAALGSIAAAAAPLLPLLGEALAGAITTLAPAITALAPAATALIGAISPLATIVADLVVSAAPGLTAFITALAAGLQALAPAAAPLGKALGDILTAVAPLLPLIGAELANALTLVAGMISILAQELAPLIGLFSAVAMPIAQMLLPVITDLISQALPILVQLAGQVAMAFAPLAPVLLEIAKTLVTQLIAFLPTFIAFLQQMAPLALATAQAFSQELMTALVALAPMIPQLAAAGLQLVGALLQLYAAFAPLLPTVVTLAALWVQMLTETGLLQLVLAAFIGIVQITAKTISLAAAAVRLLLSPIGLVIEAFRKFTGIVSSSARSIGNTMRDLPGHILSAVSGFGSLLYDAGKNVVQGLIDGIKSMFGNLTSTASNIAGTIRDFLPFSPAKKGPLSGSGNPYYSGQSIASLLAGGMESRTAIVSAASGDLAASVAFPFSGGLTPPPVEPVAGGTNEYHLHDGNATIAQLKALQDRQSMLARIGRPR